MRPPELTLHQLAARGEMLTRGGIVGGYAGTGKSFTISEACRRARGIGMPVIVAAPTNKAALVVRQLIGEGTPVQTLHSLTTQPCEIPEVDPETQKPTGRHVLGFSVRDDRVLEHVIIDEASMVGQRFFSKIRPLLSSYALVGDPFQLPPVQDAQLFTESSTMVMLTEVLRQATDSPALAYATEMRQGGSRRPQDFGVRVTDGIKYDDLSEMWPENTVCITYTNADRHWFNREIRKARWGGAGWQPRVGDKVICRESEPIMGLWRGLRGYIKALIDIDDDCAEVEVLWENRKDLTKHRVDPRHLQGREVPYDDRWGTDMQYGYAMTCHSAQGSSWERVFIVPNKAKLIQRMGARDARRWLYTALTRISGSGEVTLIQN